MRKNDNYSQPLENPNEDTEEWQYEDDWQEDSIHARKAHQSHRPRAKGDVRRNIEDVKERLQLKALLGDDFDD